MFGYVVNGFNYIKDTGYKLGIHTFLTTLVLGLITWLLGMISIPLLFVFMPLGIILLILVAIVSLSMSIAVVDQVFTSVTSNSVITVGIVLRNFISNVLTYIKILLYMFIGSLRCALLPFLASIGGLVLVFVGQVIGGGIGTAIGVIGFIVFFGCEAWYIIRALRILFIPYAKLQNPDRGFGDCYDISWSATEGKIGSIFKLFGIGILLGVVNLIPILGGIAYALVVFPTIQVAFVLFYMDCISEVGNADTTSEGVALNKTRREKEKKEKPAKKDKTQKKAPLNQRIAEDDMEEEEEITPVRKQSKHVDDFSDGEDVFGTSSTNMLDNKMIKAIQGAYVCKLTVNGDTETALPIDIVEKNGRKVFNFFVKRGNDVKATQVVADTIDNLQVTDRKFNPAQYVTWEPNWNVPRDWEL